MLSLVRTIPGTNILNKFHKNQQLRVPFRSILGYITSIFMSTMSAISKYFV